MFKKSIWQKRYSKRLLGTNNKVMLHNNGYYISNYPFNASIRINDNDYWNSSDKYIFKLHVNRKGFFIINNNYNYPQPKEYLEQKKY